MAVLNPTGQHFFIPRIRCANPFSCPFGENYFGRGLRAKRVLAKPGFSYLSAVLQSNEFPGVIIDEFPPPLV
jgi:hypothetical protein